ncbi:MAG TPA: peptidase M61 [Burkholderiaceae bacterium]|nr:peptidase M61 [Burkholderiaceae bacterium]
MSTANNKRKVVSDIHYSVECFDLNAHLFKIVLTIAKPALTQHVSLPVWIPGSYLVREFSKNLQNLIAYQGAKNTKQLEVVQSDKCSWQIDCDPAKPLQLSYLVYALDNSVRTAWLDAERGFFNGTSLCLRVEGQENQQHSLELLAPAKAKNWKVATGASAIKVNTAGFGVYQFADYADLIDCPFEVGAFWSGQFLTHGIPHRFVVTGANSTFDGARLLADSKKICETEIEFWHGKTQAKRPKPPFKNYVFLLNAVADGGGGLEHRNSTALLCKRDDLPRLREVKQSNGYAGLLGLISHEYFHTWNVKRLHPADFSDFDYSQENYTEMLWFFEGFTSYYDDLLLRRSGLIDDGQYLEVLCKTINHVWQTPGRKVQSVAEASFDAWIKYYRPEPNTSNTTVSYYTKGALVALCFDLTLRHEGPCSLDEVMRALWNKSHHNASKVGIKNANPGAITERDFAQVLEELSGRSFKKEIAAWVHGTDELPVQQCLELHGVKMQKVPATWQQHLGLRVTEKAGEGVLVKAVLRGGAAEDAGFAPGDEWIGIELNKGESKHNQQNWRIHKLDDLTLYVGDVSQSKSFTALVARDMKLLKLPMRIRKSKQASDAHHTWRIEIQDTNRLHQWLANTP